jgi:hypothetical protein
MWSASPRASEPRTREQVESLESLALVESERGVAGVQEHDEEYAEQRIAKS